jgi:hypothetical protein
MESLADICVCTTIGRVAREEQSTVGAYAHLQLALPVRAAKRQALNVDVRRIEPYVALCIHVRRPMQACVLVPSLL